MANFKLDPEAIQYDMLPPLVRKGQDRQSILDELVEAWATPFVRRPLGLDIDCGVTLDRVGLIDENTGKPIDLGALLGRVANRIAEQNRSLDKNECVAVTLRGCYVPELQASHARFPFSFRTDSCCFNRVDCSFASFGGHVWFEKARFVGMANFVSSVFCDFAYFSSSIFTGHAWFISSVFTSGSHFSGNTFADHATFAEVIWVGDFYFRDNSSSRQPNFLNASFAGTRGFYTNNLFATVALPEGRNSTSAIGHSPPIRALRLRSEQAGEARVGDLLRQGLNRARWQLVTRGNASRMRWDLVRGFGELAILTRVSMWALILVPMLAAVWPAVRGAVGRLADPYDVLPPMMPWAWGALFFSAISVICGRALYQAFAPQHVQEMSRVDFIGDRAEAYRHAPRDEQEHYLRAAIRAIDDAGNDAILRWFRHQRLVRHDGRIVWIPTRVEDFQYQQDEMVQLHQVGMRHNRRLGEQHCVQQGRVEHEPVFTAEPVMPPESRKMIAVRAGADARYDLIARQNRQWARFALWCYALAVVLVVVVLWDQSVAILRESGMAGLANALLVGAPLLCFASAAAIVAWIVWDAWFGWIRWPWLAKQWERLNKARGSFTPVDEMQAEIQRRLRDVGRQKNG